MALCVLFKRTDFCRVKTGKAIARGLSHRAINYLVLRTQLPESSLASLIIELKRLPLTKLENRSPCLSLGAMSTLRGTMLMLSLNGSPLEARIFASDVKSLLILSPSQYKRA